MDEDNLIGCMVAALEAGVGFVMRQSEVDRFYEALNAGPLEARIDHLEFLIGHAKAAAHMPPREEIRNVTYEAEVKPVIQDDFVLFDLTITPRVSLRGGMDWIRIVPKLSEIDPARGRPMP